MRKRLLCNAPDATHPAARLTGPMREWETCCVDDLGDAARALRAGGYTVGLLVRARPAAVRQSRQLPAPPPQHAVDRRAPPARRRLVVGAGTRNSFGF